ncbi:MAG TPA: hypothetical protein VLU47_02755, partial [Blastocatellia bacterium]|nr:hypothetical protein [Blastocatellia bacterium]
MQTHKSAPGALRVFALLIVSLSESLFPANPSLNCPGSAASVSADGTTQLIPLSQNWSDPGLISANDNWGGVPGIIGFRGDGLTTVAATDPQTIVADGSATPIDVIANQANPNTQTSGGVAEFDGIANPVVALQGSGTASAPHIVMSVNTTGLSAIKVAYSLRDVDGSADNAIQPVALQFRVGASGSYTNIPAGFVADASTGPSLATQVTPVSASLPGAADDQPLVQIRIITTDASGSDEWIGIDDILIFVPSVAKFDSFTAAHHEGGKVLLKWRTGFEVDNLGFNVLREQSGSRVRINSEMIAGSALMVGEGTMLRSGYSYSWADELPNGIDARYWLEAIDLNGRSSIFGPVSAIASEVRSGLPPEGGQSLSLSSVGRKAARTSLSRPVPRSAAPPQAATLQTTALPAAAMRPALKLSVDQEGWYRVTHQELTSAGFDPALDPRLLQLFAEGVEQAIAVEGEADGRMSPTD